MAKSYFDTSLEETEILKKSAIQIVLADSRTVTKVVPYPLTTTKMFLMIYFLWPIFKNWEIYVDGFIWAQPVSLFSWELGMHFLRIRLVLCKR